MRYMITDELWAIMGPCVQQAKRYQCGAAPVLPDRMFVEAVLYIARTVVPWRDFPGECGVWDAGYHRLRRCVASGSLARLFELLTHHPDCGDIKRMLIDATNVWAHRCAAGAPKPVVPYKVNGTKPGRLDKKAYRKRNLIEHLIGKLKDFRRVTTRYDKLKQTFLGIVHLALGFIRLKRR